MNKSVNGADSLAAEGQREANVKAMLNMTHDELVQVWNAIIRIKVCSISLAKYKLRKTN